MSKNKAKVQAANARATRIDTAAVPGQLEASADAPSSKEVSAGAEPVADIEAGGTASPALVAKGGGGVVDWDEEDEFSWAIGTELEFLEEGVDDWDGPVGDGLDEEEGVGGLTRRKASSETGAVVPTDPAVPSREG